MPLISQSIATLVNGVSQQPAALRLPSQCELQENAFSSIVEGLKKRPPMKFVAKLTSALLNGAFIHLINRDADEQYVVIITNRDIQVYDLEGTAKTVTLTAGSSYISTSNPRDTLRAVTIADYTFVVNTDQTVAMDPGLTDAAAHDGLVFVKQAGNGYNYKIFINGVEKASYAAAATGAILTDTIAADLASDLATNLGAGWTITRENYVIQIHKDDGTDFELSTEDSFSGKALTMVKNKIQRFSDLPTLAPRDFVVEIVGDSTNQFDNYYVKFEPSDDNSTFGEGVWVECVQPGIKHALDETTMPHALIRQADGSFTFETLDWIERQAGDEETAPDPSFVGETINYLFLFENRLGFLSDDNVILSKSGEFFQFFRDTATTILDSDPIDVAVSHSKVSILRHAVPYSEQLIIFSDSTQFILEGGDLLTPKTVSIVPTTEFETYRGCKPVGAGSNIYFTANVGDYSMVREYFVSDQNNTKDAAEVTAHVPQYVPKNIKKLASANNSDILIALSAEETDTLYVYKYNWRDDKKLQSSWSKWIFNEDCIVLDIAFIDNYLYLVNQYDDGMYLEVIDVSPQQTDTGLSFINHLDRRITERECSSITYDSASNKTTFLLPYNIPDGAEMVVVTRPSPAANTPITSFPFYGVYATSGPPYGSVLTVQENLQGQLMGTMPLITYPGDAANAVLVNGDWTGVNVYIGLRYTMRYRFSTQFIKKDSGGGALVAVDGGRLQLKNWSIRYEDTGRFDVEVTPLYRDTSTYRFTGRLLGSGNNLVGSVAIEDGTFRFPIMAKNDQVTIDIVSDSHLPCFILNAEWEAEYSPKARRV
jgi:hypothetical protein